MNNMNIPLNWSSTTIGELNFYQSSLCNPQKTPDHLFELYSVPSFANNSPEILSGNDIASSKQHIQFKDVLLCKINPRINRVWCVKEKKEFTQIGSSEWIAIRQPYMEERFLAYFFQTQVFRDMLCADVSGVGGSLTRAQPKIVATYTIPVAPLAEQQCIIKKLDTLLFQANNTKNRLDRITNILTQFRLAILSSAVSGKLSEHFREDKIYEKIVLKSSKATKEFSYSNTWVNSNLNQFCKITSGNAFKSKDFTNAEEVPAIKISNIQYGKFEIKNQQFLPNSYLKKYSDFLIEPDDLLMALTRPITNNKLKVCKYPKNRNCGLLNQRVCKFKFNEGINSNFMEIFFQSDFFKLQVESNLTETLQPNLSPKDIEKFSVLIPPLSEQTEIVRRVEQLFAYADTVEKQVNAALERVNHLTQSILAKAFRGELSAQWRAENPALISGENSAAALLEKIKAQRAALGTPKKSRKKI